MLLNSLNNPVPPPAAPITPAIEQPEWIQKILCRHEELNSRYEHAHSILASAYNEFLSAIEEINMEHGTEFTFAQVIEDFKGEYAPNALEDITDDEDDEDEDEERHV